MRRVLEKRGVYVSGVLFGPVTIRDALEIGAQGLMVHHVEPGSIGEAQEIEKSDLLEAVDGVPVLEVDDLYARLNDARGKRRRVTLTFKKLAGGDTLFSYTQRNLLVGELRIIGPQKSVNSEQ
jgi:S1-C subfamily serine protease